MVEPSAKYSRTHSNSRGWVPSVLVGAWKSISRHLSINKATPVNHLGYGESRNGAKLISTQILNFDKNIFSNVRQGMHYNEWPHKHKQNII